MSEPLKPNADGPRFRVMDTPDPKPPGPPSGPRRRRLMKRVVVILILAALATAGVYVWQREQADKLRQAQERHRQNTATVLAPEIRQAWLAALDKALDERLKMQGNWIQFKDLGDVVYVPRQGVIVRCSPYEGVFLESGSDHRLQLVSLHSSLDPDDRPPIVPRLDVGPLSPAARDLMDELCLTTITTLGLRR